MVRISSITLAGFAAMGAMALPAMQSKRSGACMTEEEGAFVAANYGTLIATYTNELADKVLAENFTDYAEGVNTLINTCPQGSAAVSLPLLAPTFSSREQFEIGQGQQPQINFEQLNMWVSCNAVVIRWMTNNTAPIDNPKPVVGLIAMEVIPNTNASADTTTYPWLIDTVYSEFDSGAWLQNLQEAGICGPAPGPCDSQQVPQEANSTTTAVASSTAISSSTATLSTVVTSSTTTLSTVVSSSTATPSTSTTASGPVDFVSTPAPVSSSTATLVASSTVGAGSVEVSTVTSVAVATSTSTMTIVINPDGSIEEVPCNE